MMVKLTPRDSTGSVWVKAELIETISPCKEYGGQSRVVLSTGAVLFCVETPAQVAEAVG